MLFAQRVLYEEWEPREGLRIVACQTFIRGVDYASDGQTFDDFTPSARYRFALLVNVAAYLHGNKPVTYNDVDRRTAYDARLVLETCTAAPAEDVEAGQQQAIRVFVESSEPLDRKIVAHMEDLAGKSEKKAREAQAKRERAEMVLLSREYEALIASFRKRLAKYKKECEKEDRKRLKEGAKKRRPAPADKDRGNKRLRITEEGGVAIAPPQESSSGSSSSSSVEEDEENSADILANGNEFSMANYNRAVATDCYPVTVGDKPRKSVRLQELELKYGGGGVQPVANSWLEAGLRAHNFEAQAVMRQYTAMTKSKAEEIFGKGKPKSQPHFYAHAYQVGWADIFKTGFSELLSQRGEQVEDFILKMIKMSTFDAALSLRRAALNTIAPQFLELTSYYPDLGMRSEALPDPPAAVNFPDPRLVRVVKRKYVLPEFMQAAPFPFIATVPCDPTFYTPSLRDLYQAPGMAAQMQHLMRVDVALESDDPIEQGNIGLGVVPVALGEFLEHLTDGQENELPPDGIGGRLPSRVMFEDSDVIVEWMEKTETAAYIRINAHHKVYAQGNYPGLLSAWTLSKATIARLIEAPPTGSFLSPLLSPLTSSRGPAPSAYQ